jgi:alpha-galactosidase
MEVSVIKIALIGAGSAQFAQMVMTDILAIEGLDEGMFALVDLDSERLELSHAVAEQLIKDTGKSWSVQASTERRSLLPDCNYVINLIEVGGLANIYDDYAIPLKYGVDQCIADTIGPGGVFKYLRTAPSWLAICGDIEELCPRALVINYTNPMSALTLTALRATSLQVVGLCISTIETAYQLADYAWVPFEQMRYRCAGINHLAWFVTLEIDGEDLYPRIYRAAENPEVYREDPIRFEILRHFGAFVTEAGRLVSEYVPYFRKRKDLLEAYLRESADLAGGQRARTWPLDRAEHDAMVRHDLERERRGERAFFLERSLEHCSNVIEGHALNRPQLIHGNVVNAGVIENLPFDGCVEVPCLIDGTGIHAVHFGRLPTQMAALDSTHMMVHDLLVQAFLNEDREAAVHALMLDPLTAAVCSPAEIPQMFDELAAKEQAYLPRFINPA